MNVKLKRKIINSTALLLSMAAMAFSLFWLIWILWMVFEKGFSSLSLTLFTENTPPPGSPGGLKNAMAGSARMVGLAMFMATPIAIMAGLSRAARAAW